MIATPHLSPREQHMLREIRGGYTDKEVGWRLGLTEGTVKQYMLRLRRKIGAGNRVLLALYAEQHPEAWGGTKGVTVKATREGLVGGKTASGYVIDTVVPFVALPSAKALGRFVRVTNPANGKACVAVVLDVGPWNEHDDAYVFGGARPASESGHSVSLQGTNAAGIDLGEKVWRQLAMTGNTDVAWEFIS